MPQLMKNGEFAAFCRTTKDTLIHYDREGIVKPARVSEAGYRLYRPEQFFLMSLVTLLQQADMPLAAIRGILEAPAAELVLTTVKERQKALQAKIAKLQAAEGLLSGLIEEAERVLAMPEGELVVADCPAQRVRVFSRPASEDWTDLMSAQAYAACMDWDAAHSAAVVPPSGCLIPADCVKKGLLVPQAVYTRENGGVAKAPGAPRVKTLSAGRWAMKRRRLSAAEARGAVEEFLADLAQAGLEGVGDLYLEDEFNYLFPGQNPERFELVIRQRLR